MVDSEDHLLIAECSSKWASEKFPALAVLSRATFSTSSLSLHSLGISSAVTNKINFGALLRIKSVHLYVYGWENLAIATWL